MVRRILTYLVISALLGGVVVGTVYWRNWTGSTAHATRYVPPPTPAPKPRHWTWDEVEQEMDRLRAQRKEQPAAGKQLAAWYDQLYKPEFTGSKDYAEHLNRLKEWRKAFPNSPTPLLVLARSYINWAWEARGTGVAYTVSEEGWDLFSTRINEARIFVKRALELPQKDAEGYSILVTIAMAEGHPESEARDWVAKGMEIDPRYNPLYASMTHYLLPRWHGNPGDIERFAAEIADKLPGDDGLDAYAHIAWTANDADCTGSGTLFFGGFDRKRLAEAALVVTKRYPHVPALTHFAALCTIAANDHAAAIRIRPHVEKYYQNAAIWPWEYSHKDFLNWCDSEDVPSDQTYQVWTSHYPHGGIAFAKNSRYVWCGCEYNQPAALFDLQQQRARKRLSVPSATVNNVVVDLEKNWVVASTWQPAHTLIVYDVSAASETKAIHIEGPCTALAVNPRKSEIAWTNGVVVELVDVSEEKRRLDIGIPHRINSLCYSPDGNLLAIGGNELVVYDLSAGSIRYRLPETEPEKIYQNLLALDDQGLVLGIVAHRKKGKNADPENFSRSLVQCGPDGEGKPLLNDLYAGATCLSPDRRLLATVVKTSYGRESEGIHVWDIERRTKIKECSGQWCRVESLAISADNRWLACTGNRTGVLKVWSLSEFADSSLNSK